MKLNKPRRVSEATIQAELYMQLRLIGIECYLEYPIKLGSCSMRADIAIAYSGVIVGLIEVKSRTSKRSPSKKTRQYNKYKEVGLPFIYCMCMEDVDSVIKWSRKLKESKCK